MTEPKLVAIVAVDLGWGIGVDGDLPWRLPGDLRRFKAETMGHPILMGRTTHLSIGRALPGRRNLVLSRDGGFEAAEGCETFSSIAAALDSVDREERVYVIGGATVYERVLDYLSEIHLTVVHDRFRVDTVFPALDPSGWSVREQTRYGADDKNVWSCTVSRLEPSGGPRRLVGSDGVAPAFVQRVADSAGGPDRR